MTKIMTESGWVYIVIVLNWYMKKVVGYYSGKTVRSRQWLEALDMGLNSEFPYGARRKDLNS